MTNTTDKAPLTVVIENTAAESEAGLRVDQYLRSHYPRFSRNTWQRRCDHGSVFINGMQCRASRRINPGDKISFSFVREEEPEVNSGIKIISESDDFLIVDKPGDLPVHPTGPYVKNTVHGVLISQRGEGFRMHFANRLDRETSGVLVIARNAEALHHYYSEQKKARILKEYLVLIEGKFRTQEMSALPDGWFRLEGFLDRAQSRIQKKRAWYPERISAHSEAAVTDFRPLIYDQSSGLSLLQVRLHTGRMHQIRASLCSLQMPVTGDKLYGLDDAHFLNFLAAVDKSFFPAELRLGRTALHCAHMRFCHRISGEMVSYTSFPPSDMAAFLPQPDKWWPFSSV